MLTSEKIIASLAKAQPIDVMLNEWRSNEDFHPFDRAGWTAYRDAKSDISHFSIGSRQVYFYTNEQDEINFLVIDEDGDLIQSFVMSGG